MRRIPGIFVVILALAFVAAACGTGDTGPDAPPSSEAGPVASTASTAAVPSTETPPPETPATAPGVDLMSDSIAYAQSLGGVSRQGDTLFFVVGAETDTEAEAVALLQEGTPFFGDMVAYFIVQKSDNFDGMAPGKYVIIEAYDSNPSAENVEFGRRAFPTAYVVRATVLTSDPIPVYEDRLGL